LDRQPQGVALGCPIAALQANAPQNQPRTNVMQSKATKVDQYLAELTDDRREALAAVREVILENLDKDYEEGMQYGMIGYYVPHRVHPAGYHCDPRQPLPFAALASQKNYMSLYLMCVYGESEHSKWFRKAWAETGKKLDMGKACVRFKKLEDLPLDVIGEAIRRVPAKKYVAFCEAAVASMQKRTAKGPVRAGKTARSTKTKKPARKKPR
jgi:hypothetical protein